jgi:hypothetical protein
VAFDRREAGLFQPAGILGKSPALAAGRLGGPAS